MHPIEIRCARLALAITASFCLLAAPAVGDDESWEQTRWHALNARFSINGGEFSSGQRWLESQLHTTRRHEFEYSRSPSLNLERKFVFGIQRPIAGERVPGLFEEGIPELVGERVPGLAFEVRF